MTTFSDRFISNPRLAWVIAILMALCGALCLLRMPISEYPNIIPVTITVKAMYTGATSEVVNESVGMVLEDQINAVDDVWYFKSTSNAKGNYSCNVMFRPGVSSDIALVNVQNAVKRAEKKLPAEVVKSGIVVKKSPEDRMALYMFTTDGRKMDIMALSNFVEKQVADAVARLDGVALVETGGRSYSMRLWLDPQRLSGLGMTVDEVRRAIESQNMQAAAGTIGNEFSNDWVCFKVNVKGRLQTKEEFENIIVRDDAKTGSQVRMKDIARVELGSRGYAQRSKFNDDPAVRLEIYKAPEANAVATAERVKAEIDKWLADLPEGVHGWIADDSTAFTVVFLKETAFTLVVALVLVVFITYMFLQDWRATFIPAIAIPIALLGALAILRIAGFSLNILTMFGLILVIGLLVDDAIVVVENTQALMAREGLSAVAAARKSMGQITGAVVSTAFVTLACYLPLVFFPGMVGLMYVQFAVTMCVALVLSTVIALVLSPVLCAFLLRPPRKTPPVLFRPFNWMLDTARKTYLSAVLFLVRNGLVAGLLFLMIVAASVFLSRNVPSAFLPEEDRGFIRVRCRLSEGQTLARTSEVMDRFHEMARGIPGVESVSSTCGKSSLWGEGENLADGLLRLEHWDRRKNPGKDIASILRAAQDGVSDLYAGEFVFQQPPAIRGLGGSSGVGFNLCDVEGRGPQALLETVDSLVETLSTNRLVKSAVHGFTADTPQLELRLDRTKCQTLGLTPKDVFATLQSRMASLYVNDFNLKGGVYEVKIQNDAEGRRTIENITDIVIPTASGEGVPLSSIASIAYTVGPREMMSYNKMLAAAVDVLPAAGVASSEVMRLIESVPLPKGYRIEWGRIAAQEKENEGQLVKLLALSVLLAYLFLVAQYASWSVPLGVMLSTVVAVTGAFLGLWLTRTPLSIYAQLGCVMLVALSAKNAILMVEFSKRRRERGVAIRAAALDGARLRFRAVQMTAWGFVFGVIPLVFAKGAGSGALRAIGICTCSGMLLSTFVGIIFVPALYSLVERLREFIRGKEACTCSVNCRISREKRNFAQ